MAMYANDALVLRWMQGLTADSTQSTLSSFHVAGWSATDDERLAPDADGRLPLPPPTLSNVLKVARSPTIGAYRANVVGDRAAIANALVGRDMRYYVRAAITPLTAQMDDFVTPMGDDVAVRLLVYTDRVVADGRTMRHLVDRLRGPDRDVDASMSILGVLDVLGDRSNPKATVNDVLGLRLGNASTTEVRVDDTGVAAVVVGCDVGAVLRCAHLDPRSLETYDPTDVERLAGIGSARYTLAHAFVSSGVEESIAAVVADTMTHAGVVSPWTKSRSRILRESGVLSAAFAEKPRPELAAMLCGATDGLVPTTRTVLGMGIGSGSDSDAFAILPPK